MLNYGKIHLIAFSCSLLILGCSDKKEMDATIQASKTSTTTIDTSIQSEADCIFENDSKKLTADWIKESGFEKFDWDEQNQKAIIINGLDTIYVFKGGCNQEIRKIEIISTNKSNNLLEIPILQIVNDMACKFKFEGYCGMLLNNQFDQLETGDNSIQLDFEDNNPDENRILEGIRITPEGKNVRITISEYYD